MTLTGLRSVLWFPLTCPRQWRHHAALCATARAGTPLCWWPGHPGPSWSDSAGASVTRCGSRPLSAQEEEQKLSKTTSVFTHSHSHQIASEWQAVQSCESCFKKAAQNAFMCFWQIWLVIRIYWSFCGKYLSQSKKAWMITSNDLLTPALLIKKFHAFQAHSPHSTMLRNLRSHTGPIPCTINTRWSTCGISPEGGRAATHMRWRSQKKNTVTRVEINQRTLVLTIRDFIMIIIYAPLDHSGPCLAILCGAPLIWHSRRLELHDHLEKMAKHNA